MAKKILFAEDEETLQKTMSQRLGEEGYEVIAAYDGEEALRIAEEKKPDLILLDLILPKMDGFDVLEKLKSDKELDDIPVIVLTNLETNRDIQRVLDAGATTYLVKANYEIDDVLQKVKNILHK